jgi:hypothetical protein
MGKNNMLYDPWTGDAIHFDFIESESVWNVRSIVGGHIGKLDTRTAWDFWFDLEEMGFLEPDKDLIYIIPKKKYIH